MIRLFSAALLMSLLLASLASRGGSSETTMVPEELHARATAQGTVRVIVRLSTPFAPEGYLASAAQVMGQRQMLAGVQAAVRRHLRGVRHRVVREFNGMLPLMAIEASPDALQMLDSLRGIVAEVHEDVAYPLLLAQSVPLINGDDVWAAGYDGTGQIVAILDTGVQADHPFLNGKVIAEACFSTTTRTATGTTTTVCPSGSEAQFGAGAALPCGITGCDHGTHVAGIAAGTGPSFSGVARGARIIAIQVFSRFNGDLDCGGFPGAAPCIRTFTSDQIEALNYVHAQRQIFSGRIAAVNMSLGGSGFTAACDGTGFAQQKPAIDQLRAPHPTDPTDAGVATVIAAGNFGFTDAISSPACISSAIAVASSTKTDGLSSFTNIALPAIFPSLLVAPGSSIQSSVPGSSFAFFSGTSMAAPHVAGAFAVLRDVMPTASVDTLLDQLKAGGKPITDTRPPCPNGCDSSGSVAPRIDLLAALARLGPPNLVVQTLTAPAAAVPGGNISVSSSIRNIGIGPAAASNLKLYLSDDDVITTGDRLLGTVTFNALKAGLTSSVATLSVQIPPSVAQPGSYFIGAIADADAQRDETDETDNTKSVPIQIVLPDLTVPVVTFSPPATAPGANISVTHTVGNVAASPATAPVSFSGIYLGVTQSIDTAVGGRLALVGAPAVTGGATSPAVTAPKVTIPGDTPVGRYFVLVRANDTAAFPEGAAGNVGASSTTILVGPDLTLTAASTSAGISPGGNLSVTYTIKNQGGQAAGAFDVAFALVPQAGGPEVALGPSRTVAGLAAGATATFTSVLAVPPATPAGAFRVRVTADGTGAVLEADETNNVLLTGVVNVGLPDLTVPTVTFTPAATAPGGSVTVVHTVKNVAPLPGAAGGSFSRLRMTPSQNLSMVTDLGLVSVPPLLPGAMATVSRSVQIPGNTSVGLYYLSASADDPGSIVELDESAASNLRFSLARLIVGPDVLPTAASTVTGAAPGANVGVTYTLKNQGGQATGLDVAFALVPQPSGTPVALGPGRVIASLAPGATTSFTSVVTIPADSSPGAYRIQVQVNPSSDADPSNNSRLTGAVTVVRPDLKVPSVTFTPVASFPGGSVTVTHTVKNVSAAPGHAGPSTTRLQLGTTPTSSLTDLGLVSVPAIAAGATFSVPKSVPIPMGTAPGLYYVLARADAQGAVVETNDDDADNLGASATRIIIGPDIVPTAATTPATVGAGANLSVSYTLKNQGGTPTGPFTVSFALVPVGGGGDIPLAPTAAIATIPAGGTMALTKTLAIPATLAGPHRIRIVADSGDAVMEADETNNTRLAAGTLNIVQPNLTVPPFTFTPAASAPNGTVTVRYAIKNAAPAPGNAAVSAARLFLSVDRTVAGELVSLGTDSVAPIAAGATLSTSRVVTLPGNLSAGKYFFGMQADPGGSIPESDESAASNYGFSSSAILIGPDVVPTTATAPAAVGAGANLSVSYTLKNQGGAGAGPFDVSFALVPVNAAGVAIGPDVPLAGGQSGVTLPAGGTKALSNVVSIPSLASGLHRVRIIADPADVVTEADEGNNSLLTTGTLDVRQPDLSMQAVTATPAALAPAGNVSVTQTIKNLTAAPGGAGPTTSRLYLSPTASPVVALASPVIGDVAVPAMAGMVTVAVTRSLPLPAGTVPGKYWIYARANAVNPIDEVDAPDPINNMQRTANPILVGPDLTLTALTVPALASPNLTIPVVSTVKNQGGQGTSGSVVRFFLSTTGALDGSQIPLGVTSTAALNPGASFTTTTRLTLPANTSAGARFLLAQADAGVPEADETNNLLLRTVTIQLPNIQIVSITTPAAVIRGRIAGAPSASVVVRNIGAVAAAPFDVQVFASRDDGSPGARTPGGGDLLFTRTVPALAANGTATISGPIVIPEGSEPNVRQAGHYFVSATADPTGEATGDSVLGNNVLTLESKLLPVLPDMTRLHRASVALTLQPACQVPGDELHLQGDVDAVHFTSQSLGNPSTFRGTVALDDAGQDFHVVYTITGTVRALSGMTAGAIQSTFTYAGAGTSGTGTITGAAAGLDFEGGILVGQQTGLPGCSFAGTVNLFR